MEPVCREYTPGPSENQIPPYLGQDDLFKILELELSHTNLIRNFSPYAVEYGGPTYIKLFLRDGPTRLYHN